MHIPVSEQMKEIMRAVFDTLEQDASLVLVGGSVRDLLMDETPKDYDFATALVPDEVERRVRAAGRRAYTVGKRFGTIGFRLDGHFIEVTTFRSELYDAGSRKPSVTFTEDLEADLSRRDFTVNAMALGMDGALIDPFGGQKDIQAKLIRAVGKPKDRFQEDPLRMLRLVRLAARFDFSVETGTAKAAMDAGYLLTTISAERISTELDGVLVAPHVTKGLNLLSELGLLSFSVPLLAVQVGYDQNSPYHSFTLWEHTVKTVAAMQPDLHLRWAALLHDVGKPFVRRNKPDRSSYVHHDRVGAELVTMIARHLKWPNDRRNLIRDLVRNHMDPNSPTRQADNAAK